MSKSRLTVAFLILTFALFSTMLARAASDAGAAPASVTAATHPGSLDRKVPSPICRAG
jgi:hypothetical protein